MRSRSCNSHRLDDGSTTFGEDLIIREQRSQSDNRYPTIVADTAQLIDPSTQILCAYFFFRSQARVQALIT